MLPFGVRRKVTTTRTSVCRCCGKDCSILVDTDYSGRVTSVRGNGQDPFYVGYSCVKAVSKLALPA